MDAMQPNGKSNLGEKKICGAQLRNKPGQYCQRAPSLNRERCKLHGGATPRGIASVHTKRGYMSQDLPTRLMAHMEAALNDQQLHSMNRDIAFVSARIDDVLSRLVNDHDARTAWEKLLSHKEEFTTAHSDEARTLAVTRIFEVIARAGRELTAYDEVHQLIEQRGKLIKLETDRQVKLSSGFTLDQVALYFRALSTAVRDEVDDETLGRIYAAFERINARNARLRVATEGAIDV